jgi:hypothetical protein
LRIERVTFEPNVSPTPPSGPGERFVSGPLWFMFGIAIHIGLYLLSSLIARSGHRDPWAIAATVFCMIPYEFVGTLCVVTGLRHMLGPTSLLDRWIRGAKRKLWYWMAAASVLIVVVVIVLCF